MIKIAIVGTGGMANGHAECFRKIPGCKVVAGCDVDAARARAFADKHGIPHAFGSVKELIKFGGFDAVSNVTPDAFHAPISLEILKAGKHVLCEKPLATNHADAAKMAAAAKKAGVINMVNFSYRNNACIHKAAQMIAAGKLGRVLFVEGVYYQSWLAQDAWGAWKDSPGLLWRLSKAHGSLGVLGDVGVHLLDFVSYPVQSAAGELASVNCKLKTHPKAPGDKVGEYVLDANDSAVITAEFANGALGSFRTTRWATGYQNTIHLTVFGEEGALRIDLDQGGKKLDFCPVKKRQLGEWQTLEMPATPNMYARFIKSIKTGKNDQPDFARGAAIQKALDACVKSDAEDKTVRL